MKSLRTILKNPRYFGPAWVFASLNILFGTWVIYIPSVKEKLGIDKADLGIAIFFLSFGVFTVFPIAAKVINKIGVGKATSLGILGSSIMALLPLLAPDYYLLMGALYLFGAFNGFTDIAMNTLVTEIEKQDRQMFMSAAHGFFSLGGVLAGLGSFFIMAIGSPPVHMLMAVVLVLGVNAIFFKRYYHVKAAPVRKEPFNMKLFKPLMVIGAVAFIAMGSEGAIIDWSGLYLKEISMAPEALWGAGFLGFQITMTLGRFVADAISTKIGSVKIVALGACTAIVGFVMVLSTVTYMAILGFALIGLGFSVMAPEFFRIGGNVPGINSAQGVSFIAGMGYSGFLVAPPILGVVAKTWSLVICFIGLLGCVLLILMATLLLHRKRVIT
ncbi:MFS transporter [Maribacter polysaccharolyticus]|uniref:MFS transporter n=1 Tax=Maribacter polysaccharolyticus TaxID=3020831 RepID=UPI00237F8E49|nr:MFS transporter [Maribacter polysaccharolyticus]MDE3743901.1 MFS transporter [Maribacter polysaccharolyticus]